MSTRCPLAAQLGVACGAVACGRITRASRTVLDVAAIICRDCGTDFTSDE